MTRLIDVPTLADLIRQHGPARFIADLADTICDDFLRWPEGDKCARVASHSPSGVIELMPVVDAQGYAFKYVNGRPGNPFRHDDFAVFARRRVSRREAQSSKNPTR
jgi:ornithine cyclodeaminase